MSKGEARVKREYTVGELVQLPTLEEGHFSACKVELPDYRVWLMRVSASDGYYGSPVVYQVLVEDAWEPADSEGRPIPKKVSSITVVGRHWFDSRAGDSLHSVCVSVNRKEVACLRGVGGGRVSREKDL